MLQLPTMGLNTLGSTLAGRTTRPTLPAGWLKHD